MVSKSTVCCLRAAQSVVVVVHCRQKPANINERSMVLAMGMLLVKSIFNRN